MHGRASPLGQTGVRGGPNAPRPLGYVVVALVSLLLGVGISDVTRSPSGIEGTFAGGAAPYRTPATLAVRTVAENAWVKIESHTVRMTAPNGKRRTIRDWWWVQVADHINVMPQVAAGVAAKILSTTDKRTLAPALRNLKATKRAAMTVAAAQAHQPIAGGADAATVPLFILYRQNKYGIAGDGTTVAVVGGLKNDSDIGLRVTAVRELHEELGLRAGGAIVPFGEHRIDGNRGCGTIGTFLATGCVLDEAYRPPDDGDTGDLEQQEALLVGLRDLEIALARQEIKELKWSHTVAMTVLYHRIGLRRDGQALGGAEPFGPELREV